MRRNVYFVDSEKGEELVLPVTPESFSVEYGQRVETVNIHTVGDVALAGYGTLAPIVLDSFFPNQDYPFSLKREYDPYGYVEKIQKWIESKSVLRYIVSETKINLPVQVERITAKEQDGTGDVYFSLSLLEYRSLASTEVTPPGENKKREQTTTPDTPKDYVIKKGDTLSSISKKFYGDSSLAYRLATANGISNPNLIVTGRSLALPSADLIKSYDETKTGSRKAKRAPHPGGRYTM